MSRLNPTPEQQQAFERLKHSEVEKYLRRLLDETTDTMIGTRDDTDLRHLQGQARLARKLLGLISPNK